MANRSLDGDCRTVAVRAAITASRSIRTITPLALWLIHEALASSARPERPKAPAPGRRSSAPRPSSQSLTRCRETPIALATSAWGCGPGHSRLSVRLVGAQCVVALPTNFIESSGSLTCFLVPYRVRPPTGNELRLLPVLGP